MAEEPVTDFEGQLRTLETRLGHEVRKLEIVREVASALGSTLDLDRLLDLILSRLTPLLDADRSTLYLMTEDGRELTSKRFLCAISEATLVLTRRPMEGSW